MAKPGAGKRKMAAQRKKQWNSTTKSLKSTGRAVKKGWKKGKKACYVATCVYGSYDCPEVWVLRRFRDTVLDESILGKAFISVYYSVSPTIVKFAGNSEIIRMHWKRVLDKMVERLKRKGFDDKPYKD
ncbi:MAG: hypothetical protein E7424_08230 [Ruminococcaceae bacterium]|nr:hypothetical protein [Oscillospiraceae bacterium]